MNDFSRPSFDQGKHVFVSLDDVCNRRCVYCYQSEERLSKSVPVDRAALKAYLDTMYSEHGYRLLTIAGGEPGLVSDLCQIVREFSQIGYRIIINTNGAISPSRIAELSSLSVFAISYSLDSHLRGVNDEMRFDGSWTSVCKGIDYCKKLGIRVRINAVVCKRNRSHVMKLLQWCDGKKVDVLNIHELDATVNSSFLGPLKLSPTEWRSFVLELLYHVQKSHCSTALRVPISYLTETESRSIAASGQSCPAVHNDMQCVTPDLSVYRCPLLVHLDRPSYQNVTDSLVSRPTDGLEAASNDTARCPLSFKQHTCESGLVDACKLVKITLNDLSGGSNVRAWADILST